MEAKQICVFDPILRSKNNSFKKKMELSSQMMQRKSIILSFIALKGKNIIQKIAGTYAKRHGSPLMGLIVLWVSQCRFAEHLEFLGSEIQICQNYGKYYDKEKPKISHSI